MSIDELKSSVMQLTNLQKKELMKYMAKSIKVSYRLERGKEVLSLMESIVREPITTKVRTPLLVWARAMVAYQLYDEGFTQEFIGDVIKRDHCSVCHLLVRMHDLLELPNQYPDIYPIWEKFKTSISNDIH